MQTIKPSVRGAPVSRPQLVVLGTSSGAVETLSALLPLLPKSFPIPILLVVHLPADRKSALVECLQPKCQLHIVEAEDKIPVECGTVYIAPPDYHLMIDRDRRVSLSSEDPVRYSRPSIDVLFESAADVFGSQLIGVVLSGANSDGAHGLRAICDAGGIGVIQSPSHAKASAMPLAAIEECPDALVVTLPEIATYLVEAVTAV